MSVSYGDSGCGLGNDSCRKMLLGNESKRVTKYEVSNMIHKNDLTTNQLEQLKALIEKFIDRNS